jgi:hypothetical protein
MVSILKHEDTLAIFDSAHKRGAFESTYLLLSNIEPLLKSLRLNDIARLSILDSHNHARLVKDSDGNKLVLKLIGQDTSLETECLKEWGLNPNTKGLVPNLVDYGTLPNNGKWNLQEYVEGESILVDTQVAFSQRNKDYEKVGALHSVDAFKLAASIRSNNFNRNIFPDEIKVLISVLERESDSNDKLLSKLSNHLIETKEFLTPDRMFLIHGDFHAGNIIKTTNGFKAIDPFGMAGTKASDAAKYIALSVRDENIKENALIAEDLTECSRLDLGWLIAANIIQRLSYMNIMGTPSRNIKGNIALAYKAMEIW